MIKKTTFIILIPFLFIYCEENPFASKSDIPHRTIKGFVRLEGVELYPNGNHSNVFIWMKELAISGFSGADGSFELDLPAASTPTGGGIADGDYFLYFYMGNYQLSKVKVTFAGGEILNDDRVIKINGELRNIINMTRMVQIHTTILPNRLPTSFTEDIKVTIKATPDRNDVFFYLKGIEAARQPTRYSGLLIKNVSSGELIYSFNPDTAGTIKRFIEKPYREFLINFKVVDDSLRPMLTPGSYEAIPYIIIESNDIPPDQLTQALGEGYNEFSQNYFSYPLYRTGGRFTITE